MVFDERRLLETDDWPAAEAQQVFHHLHELHVEAAETTAAEVIESLPATR